MNNNIILIGMMGSGKTSIGMKLAEKLNYDFLDMDREILKKNNFNSITEIFESKGEKFFRDLETKLLNSISNMNKCVIATGGGVILRDKNIKKLREIGEIIYLESSIENLVNNLSNSSDRPLLNNVNIKDKLNKILNNRRDNYIETADIIINVEELGIEEIVEEIVKYYY